MSTKTLRNRITGNLEYLSSIRIEAPIERSGILSLMNESLKRSGYGETLFLDKLIEVSEIYGISLDTLLKRNLHDFSEKKEHTLFRHLQVEDQDEHFAIVEVPFVSVAAASEYLLGGDPRNFPALKLPRRLFPAFQIKSYASFEIEGDSMMPDVEPGSIIIGELVETPSNFNDGWRYIVVHASGIHFKRLFRADDYAISKKIRMVSDNFPEHTEFLLEIQDIRELWRPHQIISKTT